MRRQGSSHKPIDQRTLRKCPQTKDQRTLPHARRALCANAAVASSGGGSPSVHIAIWNVRCYAGGPEVTTSPSWAQPESPL
jgi:hypothetical protein